jgi:hypothetical protein
MLTVAKDSGYQDSLYVLSMTRMTETAQISGLEILLLLQ